MDRFDTVLLLGGGTVLDSFAAQLRELGVAEVIVLSSSRHLAEPLEGHVTLRTSLEARGLRIVEVATLTVATLSDLGVDLARAIGFSFGAAWIIRQDVIDLLDGRLYNLHGARLPQDRGGASVSWQILRGNRYGYALLHRMDAGVDTGEILAYKEFVYDDGSRPIDYQRRLVRETLALLRRLTPQLLAGSEPAPISQPPYLSSYWPRLNTEIHGWIDWSWSGLDIVRFIAAFDEPYAGAHTQLDGRTVHLKSCELDTSDGPFHPFQAGLIYRVSGDYAAVCATTGTIAVRRLLDQEGTPLALDDLRVGDRFFTPAESLERARRTRVQYSPSGLRPPRTR
jgi:methionyl-tRNA formyltransferase